MKVPWSDPLTSVGTSIDVEVRADPTSCSVTVAQLSSLADTCARAEAALHGHAQLAEDRFGGLSGIVYRHSSTLLTQAAERIGGRSRRLADGLTRYAEVVTRVQRFMDDAVAVASPHLTVGAGRIWSPVGPSSPDDTRAAQAWVAWRDAVSHWRAGRELEREATQAWLRVVHRGAVIDDGEPPAPLQLDGQHDGQHDGQQHGQLGGAVR